MSNDPFGRGSADPGFLVRARGHLNELVAAAVLVYYFRTHGRSGRVLPRRGASKCGRPQPSGDDSSAAGGTSPDLEM